MLEEQEKRKSKDFKINEVNKRIKQIKETIEYRIKMEEINAQPK